MSGVAPDSVDGPDAPNVGREKYRKMADKVDSAVNSFGNPPAVAVTPANANATSAFSAYPSTLYTTDPQRDRRYNLRQQLVEPNGVVPGVGLATVGEDYFDYISDKAKQTQLAQFRAWLLGEVIDTSTPEKAEYWKGKFPELFKDKQDLLERQMDLHKQFALIQLRGPQDMDDFYLIWAKQQGLVKLENVAPWDPKFVPQEESMYKGLFNLKRFFPSGNKPWSWKLPLLDVGRGASNAGEFGIFPEAPQTARLRSLTQQLRSLRGPG